MVFEYSRRRPPTPIAISPLYHARIQPPTTEVFDYHHLCHSSPPRSHLVPAVILTVDLSSYSAIHDSGVQLREPFALTSMSGCIRSSLFADQSSTYRNHGIYVPASISIILFVTARACCSSTTDSGWSAYVIQSLSSVDYLSKRSIAPSYVSRND